MSIETKITNEGKWEIYDDYNLLVEPSDEWLRARQSNSFITPEPTLAEIQAQQLVQAEAIAAIFERLEGGA
jgi:hypothetical protein